MTLCRDVVIIYHNKYTCDDKRLGISGDVMITYHWNSCCDNLSHTCGGKRWRYVEMLWKKIMLCWDVVIIYHNKYTCAGKDDVL